MNTQVQSAVDVMSAELESLGPWPPGVEDRKSTRLNSSHG